jgi:ankyrin repeat protein
MGGLCCGRRLSRAWQVHGGSLDQSSLCVDDPNAGNGWGYTPLHLASRRHNARLVNLVIAHGAAVDVCNKDGDTPLLVAIRWHSQDVIPLLLAHGADRAVHNKC